MDRTEQSEALHQLGLLHRDVLADDCAHGMADEMRALDAKRPSRPRGNIDEALDGDRRGGGRATGARKVRSDRPVIALEAQHLGTESVRGSAKPVQHDDRIAAALGLDLHALDGDRGHADASACWTTCADKPRWRTGFSSTPMPAISILTVSPCFRYFGGLKPIPTPTGVPVAMMSPG